MTVMTCDTRGVVAPNPGAQTLFAEDWEHAFISIEQGWGGGKTWVGARKLITLHQYNAFDYAGRATGVASAVVAPTYRGAMDYCVPEMFTACEEAGEPIEWISSRKGRIEGPAFIFPRLGTRRQPSVVMIRTADIPERIAGWQVGAAWGDEPARWKEDRHDPRNDAYIQLTGRVRHPAANFVQTMFTYTNEGDHTRIYEEFHSGYETHATYRGSTKENPRMLEFYERQKRLLTPDLAQQYLEGEAISLRGARVYPQYEPDIHIFPAVKLIEHEPLCLSLDFNIEPGMHGLIGQYDRVHDIFNVSHELYARRLTVVKLLEMFIRYIRTEAGGFDKYGPDVEVYGDATGGREWEGVGETDYTILQQVFENNNIPYRIRVPRKNPFVVDRLNSVNVALCDMEASSHVRIAQQCEHLRDDLLRQKRDEFGQVDKTERKLSHSADAFGYWCYYIRPARVIPVSRVGGRFGV